MCRYLALMTLMSVLAATQACKVTRAGGSGLREATDSGDAGVTGSAPLAAVQLGAGRNLGARTCFEGATGAWGTEGTAVAAPGLVPPGSERFVRVATAGTLAAGWTREPHPIEEGVEVFSVSAANFPEFLTKFATADASGGNWHLTGAFGAALEAARTDLDLARAGARFGAVVMRRTLSNRPLAAEPGAPAGVSNEKASFEACGDGYVAGQAIFDNLLVVIMAPDDAKRDAAVAAARGAAMSRDVQANVDAMTRTVTDGGRIGRFVVGSGGALRLQREDGAALEGAMNSWRRSTEPSGVRSVLTVVRLYDAYEAASGDAVATTVNTALQALASGKNRAAGLEGEARTSAQTKLTALSTALTSCAGRRFADECATVGAATTALADLSAPVADPTPPPSSSASDRYLVSMGADIVIKSKGVTADVETIELDIKPKNDRYFIQPNDPSRGTRISGQGGAEIIDATYPPGVDFDAVGTNWKIIRGNWTATLRVRRPSTGQPRIEIRASLNNNSSTIPVTIVVPVGRWANPTGEARSVEAKAGLNNTGAVYTRFSVTSFGTTASEGFARIHVTPLNGRYYIHPVRGSGYLRFVPSSLPTNFSVIYPMGVQRDDGGGGTWSVLEGEHDIDVIYFRPSSGTASMRASAVVNNQSNALMMSDLVFPLF